MRIDPELREWVLGCVIEGYTDEEISEMDPSIQSADIPSIIRPMGMPSASQRRLLRMRAEGMSSEQIAVELSTSASSVTTMVGYMRRVKKLPIPENRSGWTKGKKRHAA